MRLELKIFENNSDVRVSMAERLYYNCEHIGRIIIINPKRKIMFKNSSYKCSYVNVVKKNGFNISAAYNITSQVLRDEPLHTKCIPLHVALLVDMKKTNQLFRLAHRY